MNTRMILAINCLILRIVALFLTPALAISLYHAETQAAWGLGITMGLMLMASLPSLFWKPRHKNLYAKDGFVIVGISWVLLSAFGALPFVLSGAIPNFIDAFFETVSGFTTTGASILVEVEAMPMGLLYWRSFTHWLGGMGVLVFLLAVVPMGKNEGFSMHILRAESPGPQVGKLAPRMQSTALILYGIYIALTIAQVIALLLCKMPLFDAITTAFGTAGTGGFAIKSDSLAGYSAPIQTVTTVFMAMFGVNFNVYFLLLLRNFTRKTFNSEFRVYVGVLVAATLVVTLNTLHYWPSFGQAWHHAAFQVVSVMTTTGFATTDYNLWPQLSKTLLTLLMMLGASAGSTGGGIKVARVLIMIKHARNSVIQMLNPRTVRVVHLDGEVVDNETVRTTSVFLIFYIFICVLSVLVLSLDDFSMETNLTAMLACLNNIGPGMDAVGPVETYAGFSWLSKLVLCADMLLGRLEIFPLIMLCSPSIWRH